MIVAGPEVVIRQEKGSPLGKILGKRLERTSALEVSRQQNWMVGQRLVRPWFGRGSHAHLLGLHEKNRT